MSYKITTRSEKAEKQFNEYLDEKMSKKLELLKENPRKFLDAHKLKGKLEGLWSCWLGGDIRMIYEIDDINGTLSLDTNLTAVIPQTFPKQYCE